MGVTASPDKRSQQEQDRDRNPAPDERIRSERGRANLVFFVRAHEPPLDRLRLTGDIRGRPIVGAGA